MMMTYAEQLRLLRLLRTQVTLLRLQLQNEQPSCARRERLEARYFDRRTSRTATSGRVSGGLRGRPA